MERPAASVENRTFVKPAEMANSHVCNFDLKKGKLTDELQRKENKTLLPETRGCFRPKNNKQAPNDAAIQTCMRESWQREHLFMQQEQ